MPDLLWFCRRRPRTALEAGEPPEATGVVHRLVSDTGRRTPMGRRVYPVSERDFGALPEIKSIAHGYDVCVCFFV